MVGVSLAMTAGASKVRSWHSIDWDQLGSNMDHAMNAILAFGWACPGMPKFASVGPIMSHLYTSYMH